MQPRQLTGIARFEELPHEIGRPGKEHATFVLGRFHTQRDRHARATCHRYMPSAGSVSSSLMTRLAARRERCRSKSQTTRSCCP